MSDYPRAPLFTKHYEEGSERIGFSVGFGCLGAKVEERIWKTSERRYPGGLADPEFRADYLLDLYAVPGAKIIPSFEPRFNVGRFEIPEEGAAHELSFDFGATKASKTACIAAAITKRCAFVYFEHVLPSATAAVHKARIRQGLIDLRPEKLDHDFIWSEHFHTVGDVTGVGYKLEYAAEPYPLGIEFPGSDPGWRSREANEAFINGLFSVAKRCCFRTWADSEERCGVCQAKLMELPGLVIHERCRTLIHQIPAQVMSEEGRRDENVPRDVFDTLLYLGRAIQRRRSVPIKKKEENLPYYLVRYKEKPPQDRETAEMYGQVVRPATFWS